MSHGRNFPHWRRASAAILLAVVLLRCGSSEPSGPVPTIDGPWAFSQRLTGSDPGTSCRNQGTVNIHQRGSTFAASYHQTGYCTGSGLVLDNSGSGNTSGSVGDSTVRFTLPGCSYHGQIVGDPPIGATGTVTCHLSTGGQTYTFTGSWRVSHGPASVVITPDPATVSVSGTLPLTATVLDAAGHPLVRDLAWLTLTPDVLSVDQAGSIQGITRGTGTVQATALPASELEDSVVGGILVNVVYGFSELAAGAFHTCARLQGGGGACWGPGYDGRLGTGSTAEQPTPAPVSGGLHFDHLSGGLEHSCGVTPTNQAWCWGYQLSGELGNGVGRGTELAPVMVAGGHLFRSVSAGYAFSCGVTTDNAGYCWGSGFDGRLGTGAATAEDSLPVLIGGGLTFASISVNRNLDFSYPSRGSACGLTQAGQAFCWGNNTYGQLGVGDSLNRNAPVAVAGGHTFSAISAGGSHVCAIADNGGAWCWGAGSNGRLGNGDETGSPVPVAVQSGLTFSSVGAGAAHTCALTIAGKAYCWGGNLRGQLGTGSFDLSQSTVPTAVTGNLTFAQLSAGAVHTCALTTGKIAYCWGSGQLSQLGNGSSSDQPTPTPVVGQ